MQMFFTKVKCGKKCLTCLSVYDMIQALNNINMQITNEAYDERYYVDEKEKLNKTTGLKWFPSVTFVMKHKPANNILTEWIANKGWEESRRIMMHRANIGTFVHNTLEEMLVDGKEYNEEEITHLFKDPKDALFVKRCLLGAMNWADVMTKKYEDFKILHCEIPCFGTDYAGTVDLVIQADGEKWVIDFKTSKNIYDSHKMQIVAYMKALGIKNGAVLQLGNRTKQRYTFSVIKPEDASNFWEMFTRIKDLFYLDTKKVQPTQEAFPILFTLKKHVSND